MSAAEEDCTLKLLLLGEAGVGKSSLLLRFVEDTFPEPCCSSIGVDFKVKVILIGDIPVTLRIWDPPCQEHIFPMTNSMLRGAHGVMIVCDLTNMNSFIKMRKWCDEVREKAVHNIAILLVGNKSDLSSQRVVFAEKGKDLSETLNFPFLETSAKDTTNVDAAFLRLSIQAKHTKDEFGAVSNTKISKMKSLSLDNRSGCHI